MFNANVGTIDRLIRVALAAALIGVGLTIYAGSALGIGLAVVGTILGISGLAGFCGLYRLLGFNTCANNASGS